MELKDVILSTLAEMEDTTQVKEEAKQEPKAIVEELKTEAPVSAVENELIYLNSIKERLLVLFEGFQAPNNINIEAKVDMTLNFLEYTLATLDDRMNKLEKGSLS